MSTHRSPGYLPVATVPAYNPTSDPNPSASPLTTNNVRYADQSDNAQCILTNAQTSTHTSSTSSVPECHSSYRTNTNPPASTQSSNKDRSPSCVTGCLAFVVIVIGLIIDNLAESEAQYQYTLVLTLTRGWTGYRIDINPHYDVLGPEYDSCYDVSYDEICNDELNLICYNTDTTDTDTYPSSYTPAIGCNTESAANISLIFCIISAILAAFGVALTISDQCTVNIARRMVYSASMLSGVIGIIVWVIMDEMCFQDDTDYAHEHPIYPYEEVTLSVRLGGTMICQIVGSTLALIAVVLPQ
eukprot:48334_1